MIDVDNMYVIIRPLHLSCITVEIKSQRRPILNQMHSVILPLPYYIYANLTILRLSQCTLYGGHHFQVFCPCSLSVTSSLVYRYVIM